MLPVYNVVQSGATATQAANLAASLNIPATQLIFSNGVVSYLDSANFLRVPTMPVTDTNAINQLLADTVNPYPAVPINFEQVDLATLSNLVVLDDNTALRTASNTLASAGLSPQYGVPAIAHATLTVAYSNAAASIYSSNRLDTQVNYVFRDPAGYPFVGPGAQVQVAFGATGNVTRLLYATRQMTPGPPVPIIPSSMASNSFAGMFPPGTAFSMDIEYICPPFWPNPFRPCPCPPPPPCNVQTILPYYVAQGTFTVTDALSGQTNSAQTLRLSIPATTNSAWVPAATLVVYPMGTNGIQAYASVTGGTPPYTYIWSGSPGDLGTNNTGSSVSYVPVVRVAPPTLQISRATSAPNALAVSWVPCDPRWCDPPLPWLLENASDFLAGSNGWTPVTNSVQSSNGVNTVTIFGTAVPLFFRLRLGAPASSSTCSLPPGPGRATSSIRPCHSRCLPIRNSTVMTITRIGASILPTWSFTSATEARTSSRSPRGICSTIIPSCRIPGVTTRSTGCAFCPATCWLSQTRMGSTRRCAGAGPSTGCTA
jgi:hypothetical protein